MTFDLTSSDPGVIASTLFWIGVSLAFAWLVISWMRALTRNQREQTDYLRRLLIEAREANGQPKPPAGWEKT